MPGQAQTSMEHLFAMSTTPAGEARQNLADLKKLMDAVARAKQSLHSSPPAAADESLAVKRLVLDTDAACYHFQALDAVALSAAQQAKPFSLELAAVLAKHRDEVREYVAGLIALLCRTIHNQEVFADLLYKAHRDVSVAQRRAAALEREAREATERATEAREQASTQIAALEKTVQDQQDEATRLELEASRPLWQWKDAAADPTSSVPSQAWYEAELSYLQNKNSELDAANRMMREQRQGDVDRAVVAERRVAELVFEVERLKKKVGEMTVYTTFAEAEAQTEMDLLLHVHTVSPNLIARGGAGPSPPYQMKFIYRNFAPGRTYDLELPEHFKLVYEDYQLADHVDRGDKTTKGEDKKKGRLNLRGKPNPFRTIVNNVSDHTSIELSMRTTTRWIDEVWASRVVTAHKDGLSNLSMDPLGDCSDEFGRFIWKHFVTKYGSGHEAGIHVGDLVTSLRKHRDDSHRVRIFSEFAGVDIRRPQKALSLHIMVVHQVMNSIRPDEDNGTVWCPLELAERAANIIIKQRPKSIDASAISTFFSDTLPGIAMPDPNAGKGTEEHVVDVDLFAEALLQLLMRDDNVGLDCVITSMCARAEDEHLISLPRFMSLMGVLNATLEDEQLLAEFESLIADNDVQALSYEQFLAFARKHPLCGSKAETEKLEAKQAPSLHVLKAAIDRFWHSQARHMRRTLEDLKTKEKRMSSVFAKFSHSMTYLDRELGDGRVEILSELWVSARIMMGEALGIRKEEPIPSITKPRPSFFRQSNRKLHIMKALLPRSVKY